MNSTALGAENKKKQTINFISEAHEKFYYEKLKEVRYQDVYHKALCYCFDDLFGTEKLQTGTEQVQEIALSELHEFKGHPFKVLDDEKMQETVESIREHGVLMPGIARPMKDGGYEIIAGHRRRHACELVGLTTMPMFIRDYTDDEATIIMVDSNIQREDILPSEKAKAYRMKYDAMKHQGSKEGGLTKCLYVHERKNTGFYKGKKCFRQGENLSSDASAGEKVTADLSRGLLCRDGKMLLFFAGG